MKTLTVENRFFFHANAVALAAHIRRPKEFIISSVASSGLPATGGQQTGESAGKNHQDLISYESATTCVYGDYVDRQEAVKFTFGNYGDNTLPTVTTTEGKLSGLQITVGERQFSAGQLEARMENYCDRKNPPIFHTMSAAFLRVNIDGTFLNVTTHCDVFEKHNTSAKLLRAFKTDNKFRNQHARHFFTTKTRSGGLFGRRRPELPAGDPIYGTIVSGISWDGPPRRDATIDGNRVVIQNFGTVYFGEILIKGDFRRLTLLRFQLGSPNGGEGSAVDIDSNATSWPPE